MRQVVIENPVLNSPFLEPRRHFRFTDEGITDQITEGRRVSAYFVPIAQPKKKGGQLVFDTEWTQDRIEENKFINQVRARVNLWRERGHPDITPTTRWLLQYWTNPDRERKLFFCQIEALETAIYITEAAHKHGDHFIESRLQEANAEANPLLFRVAFKMAGLGAGRFWRLTTRGTPRTGFGSFSYILAVLQAFPDSGQQ
jgi:type III restriction enzyme